ncbi:MAG: sialate O-acetylesterase [Abditibacteriota bacterium]|nr:sialate O-acetylesterase [Abditibacteriota bacterium]
MKLFGAIVLGLTCCALPQVVRAQDTTTQTQQAPRPFVHALFADDMVLQRDKAVPIWGWASPGTKVTVTMNDREAIAATAGTDGKWMARIGPFPAGGPYTITVSSPAPDRKVVLKNVLFGDVWLCSGQSNMQWTINSGVPNKEQEITNANFPNIRYLNVPLTTSPTPQSTLNAKWQVVSPQTVGNLSAVGYFFGRELHQRLNVPIGLISSSWGGTVAEAWVSETGLRTMPDFVPAIDALKQSSANQTGVNLPFAQQMAQWWQTNDPGVAANWAAPSTATTDWKSIALPGEWEANGLPNFDGLVWFRREVEIPGAWAGQSLKLSLGPIDDRDTTFWNGMQVGSANDAGAQRNYTVPGNLVKAGRNVLAVRVLDTGGAGGLKGAAADMRLSRGNDSLSLAGAWQYQVGKALAQLPTAPAAAQSNPNAVTVLNNAMIAPLLPYGIKGAIWYQGESNAGRAKQYQTLMPVLISDWRQQFGQGNFPFYIVQLANFMAKDTEPKNDPWPHLREAQMLTTQRVPNTGLAVAIDIGEEKDIHPRNKQDVGKRLALVALARTYGQNIGYSGPVYKAMRTEGNAIRITFDHAKGLMAKGGKPTGFAIAGSDRKWVWADARIEGESIVVSSPQVTAPIAVRYAWSNNPDANLYNADGLPTVPFRSDNW